MHWKDLKETAYYVAPADRTYDQTRVPLTSQTDLSTRICHLRGPHEADLRGALLSYDWYHNIPGMVPLRPVNPFGPVTR